MSNLLEEYRRRHGIQSVCPVNEGVLFFEKDAKPSLVVLTSSFTKHALTCPKCPSSPDAIALEIFGLASFPNCISSLSHSHILPDSDLLEYVRNHLTSGDRYIPYISKGERDQERWLWDFFQRTNVFSYSASVMFSWKRFLSCRQKLSEMYEDVSTEVNWLDEAMFMATNFPSYFEVFYNMIYSRFLINRHYILTN